ncbi:uncharacterized protein LOC135937145 [Cloeon dipterum]|uniref:uncharacterized protein LOC135937145 n=1 Tax=Cloeon dipterum TaxID=197152 RepID=UPI00321F6F2F
MNELVSADEVRAVAEKMLGADAELIDYVVGKGTATVQGFMSDILRVSFRVKVGRKIVESKFVVKRQPNLESQQKLAAEFGIFEHEIAFFEKCSPLLLEQCPELPTVRCYRTDRHRQIIYMEDLKEAGFCTVVGNVVQLKDNILGMEHARKVMQTQAVFHSASVGIDFYKRFPELFEEDTFFERNGGSVMRNCVKQAVQKTLLPIALHHFKEERFIKSVEWVASDDFYEAVVAACKPTADRINVLCHGDSWANNMMFQIDPKDGNILQIKLIDFQLVRYTAGNRDLLYFLYMCFSTEFREQNKKELLALYWDTFSSECAKRGIALNSSLEKFCADFEADRIFGLMMSAVFRPTIFMDENFPQGDEALTDEQMNGIMDGGATGPEKALEEFENNPAYRRELISIISELAEYYHEVYLK